MTEPAYAHLLKRPPRQARSVARVEAILDAAAGLLAEGDIEALTMRRVADAAGVPTGTIYQFFEDKAAVVQAVAVRYVAATPDVLDRALEPAPEGWEEALARVVEGYAAQLASAPAMRALWLAGAMDPATRRLAGEADDAIALRLRAALTRLAGVPATTGAPADWRFLVTLVSGLLRQAFARDPAGDRELLARATRAATLYAAQLLPTWRTALDALLADVAPLVGQELLDAAAERLTELPGVAAAIVLEAREGAGGVVVRAASSTASDLPAGLRVLASPEAAGGLVLDGDGWSLVLRPDGEVDPAWRALLTPLCRRIGAELARLALERRLRSREAELTASRDRLVDAADGERRRLGRDLHDGAQQRLAAIVQRLHLAERALGQDDATAARERMAEARALAGETGEELARLARDLHPVGLELGLASALERLAALAPLPVDVGVELHRPLPRTAEVTAYYVVSEGLTNAAKHAAATQVRVRVAEEGGDTLVVEVADDGRGGVVTDGGGTGLLGLTDRVEALGGTLAAASRRGGGTTLRAVLPLVPVRASGRPFLQVGRPGDADAGEREIAEILAGRPRAGIALHREWELEGGPPRPGVPLDLVDAHGRRRGTVTVVRSTAVRFGDLDERVLDPRDYGVATIAEARAKFAALADRLRDMIALVLDEPDWELDDDEPVVVQVLAVVDPSA